MDSTRVQFSSLLLFLISSHHLLSGLQAEVVTFHVRNKCPFPIWPAAAPNSGHPVIGNGGFFLPSGQTRRVQAPSTWNGRLWARTGCDFSSPSRSKPACETGDCQGQLACNGSIGIPPATLVEVKLESDKSKPSFYDISLVDGYNLPISISAMSTNETGCYIGGCTRSPIKDCPKELQVMNKNGTVVACKSACLAFSLDVFCCRNAYDTPEKCKPTMYSKMFKDACPSYFSFAFDTPMPLVKCSSSAYLVTFCPSKWSSHAFLSQI